MHGKKVWRGNNELRELEGRPCALTGAKDHTGETDICKSNQSVTVLIHTFTLGLSEERQLPHELLFFYFSLNCD